MSPSLAIQRRFRFWTACVIADAVAPPVWFALAAWRRVPAVNVIGAIAFTAVAAALAGLIATTPPDAIRLPPGRSVRMITAQSAWLVGVAWLCFDRTVLGLAAGGLLVLAAAVFCHWLVRRAMTPWWAAVLLWNPAVVGPVAWSLPVVALAVFSVVETLETWTPGDRQLAAP